MEIWLFLETDLAVPSPVDEVARLLRKQTGFLVPKMKISHRTLTEMICIKCIVSQK